MSRSNFAVPCVNSYMHAPYVANGIMIRHGFEKSEYDDGEEVFKKENEELNIIQYVKFDFDFETFIFSAWIKFKDDVEKHREYRLEHFSNEAKETKELNDVIGELEKMFGNRLHLKEIYVYE